MKQPSVWFEVWHLVPCCNEKKTTFQFQNFYYLELQVDFFWLIYYKEASLFAL